MHKNRPIIFRILADQFAEIGKGLNNIVNGFKLSRK